MSAMVVFLFLTILSARMRKDHWRKLWLFIFVAITIISRHYIFSVAIIAIRACPTIESQ